MGMLDGLFGSKHPPLDPATSASSTIAANAPLARFARDAHDRLEVVPGPDTVFVFVGRPPKAFGIVWFDSESRHDFRSDMEGGLMTRDDASRIAGGLTNVYLAHTDAPRFSLELEGTKVTVVDSADLHADLVALFGGAPSA